MTTQQLVGYVRKYHLFGEKSIDVSPDIVYLAATWSQNEICSEMLLLEKVIYLELVNGQEEYQFEPQSVTGGIATTPILLTLPSHPFHTGDTVYVSGIVGLTGASGWFQVTRVDADTISLDDSVGDGAWASGGTVYHGLSAAVDVKLMAKAQSPYGIIKRKQVHTVEEER
jgi:hypothetical protein